MGENSAIGWTDHTINFWYGCTKVSPGCDHCYAESWAKRSGLVTWGHGQPRRWSETAVKEARRLDRKAKRLGIRYRVFSLSLGDLFDTEVPLEWKWRVLDVARNTDSLDWLFLTKRADPAFMHLMPADPIPNVRIGFTVENQKMADLRMPYLRRLAEAGWKTFVSHEPALGPVDWTPWIAFIGWLITGCESGHNRRPFDEDWARQDRDQCATAGVPWFDKQAPGNTAPKFVIEAPYLDGRQHLEFPETAHVHPQ